jgi:hypothetical protein
MALETATYVNQLVPANPPGSDPKSQGDDHIRLLKAVLQNTFPALTGAVTVGQGVINFLSGATSNIQTQLNDKASLTGTNVWSGTNTFNGQTNLSTLTQIGSTGYLQISYINTLTSNVQDQINNMTATLQDMVDDAIAALAGQVFENAPWTTLIAGEPIQIGDAVSQAIDGRMYWAAPPAVDQTRPLNLTGATALSTQLFAFAANASSSAHRICQLPTGNIVIGYTVSGAVPKWVQINSSGAQTIAETNLPSAPVSDPVQSIVPLGTDGKFVVLYGSLAGPGNVWAQSYTAAGATLTSVNFGNANSICMCRLSDGSVAVMRAVRNSNTQVSLFNASTGAVTTITVLTHGSDANPVARLTPIAAGGFNVFSKNTSTLNLEMRTFNNAGTLQATVTVGTNVTHNQLFGLRDGRCMTTDNATTMRMVTNAGAVLWTATAPFSGPNGFTDSANGTFGYNRTGTPARIFHVSSDGLTVTSSLTTNAGAAMMAPAVIDNGYLAVVQGNPTFRYLIDTACNVITSDATGTIDDDLSAGLGFNDILDFSVSSNDRQPMLGFYQVTSGDSVRLTHAIGNRSPEGCATTAAFQRADNFNVQIGGYFNPTRITTWNTTFDARANAIPGQKGSILGTTATFQGLS